MIYSAQADKPEGDPQLIADQITKVAQNDPNPTPGPLKVHFNISSHMDPGWIYTFEEYYQGTNTQDGGSVSALLNNVFEALQKSPVRKYSLAEICFERWWRDQSEERRKIFKGLVKNGQFEFINGGWCANDEACAYYEDIMDNFIIGHRWLKDNFGIDTSIGWQMDSFGTSATHAGLMAQAGFEGLFFSRADFADRLRRIQDKSLQFNWKPGNPRNESVLTQMLYTQYSDTKFMIPDNFWYRSIFHKGRLQGDEYKVVADYLKKQSHSFITNNTLFLVCDDFHLWREAEKDFDGIDGMIEYFDQNPEFGLKVDYSSLARYLGETTHDIETLKTNNPLPEKKDDFFPYIENKYTAWTGYFTSKSMFKLMIREHSQYYNAAKLLLSKLLLLHPKDIKQHEQVNQALLCIEAPLSMTQHHDAVTGTMKEYVKHDYERMLREGRGGLDAVLQPLLSSYLEQVLGEPLKDSQVQWDWLYRDKNYLSIFSSQNVPVLVVYNPGKDRKFLIDVKIPSEEGYQVIDETGKEIESEVIPYDQANKDWRFFFVDNIPAYSLKVYKLVKGKNNANIVKGTNLNKEEHSIDIGEKVTFTVGNDLKSFKYKYSQSANTSVADSFALDYEYYESNIVQADGKVASGAYIFNPRSQEKFKYSKIESAVVYKGKYVTLLQINRDNLRTDIKFIHHQPERGIEIESHLQPVKDFPNGKEIVLVIRSSNVKNQDAVFYTDGNGYFMQKRQKDHKDTFEFSTENGIANNYYPMTSNAYIEDNNSGQRLSIVTDRSQGMTSANPGEIEVMLHRVTLRDDWKGVSEPLQERDPVTKEMISVSTRHFLMYSNPKQGVPDMRRPQQYDLDRPVQRWYYYSNKHEVSSNPASKDKGGEIVPDLVKVYVRSYRPNEYIVRLHNIDELEAKEVNIRDGFLSKFAGAEEVKAGEVVELSWTTVKPKSELKRNKLDPEQVSGQDEKENDFTKVKLLPLEIRTFQITLQV